MKEEGPISLEKLNSSVDNFVEFFKTNPKIAAEIAKSFNKNQGKSEFTQSLIKSLSFVIYDTLYSRDTTYPDIKEDMKEISKNLLKLQKNEKSKKIKKEKEKGFVKRSLKKI